MNVKGNNNQELLNAWRYGNALAQIEDDQCYDSLSEYLSTNVLPPNIRYWIKGILDNMEGNWKDTTQKWPEPWTDMKKGSLETGNGMLIVGSGKEVDVEYSIWQMPAKVPGEYHTWGGVMVASFEHFLNLSTASIELEGQRKGRIILQGFSGNTASFIGTSNYPEKPILLL